MAKNFPQYECTACGSRAATWAGRCGSCHEWNTLEEAVAPVAEPTRGVGLHDPAGAAPIAEVSLDDAAANPTGLADVDRVLTGGLVPGSVTLIGGEPGIGKSTLLLQISASMAASGTTVLYVSGEESKVQVRARAERLDALPDGLWLAALSSINHIIGSLDEIDPGLLVVDSIQTVHDPETPSAAGSVSQVRACTARLVTEAKQRGVAVVLVGHVTKEGSLAGPRVLEHTVDTVLSFEGDRHHALRLLRAVKHRFGSTEGLGVFQMTGSGLAGVLDPSAMFLADRQGGVPGSVVVPTVDGRQPLLVEVQALVADSSLSIPRRSSQGIDGGRLPLILAVLEQRAEVEVSTRDVYVSAAGGVKLTDPGCDLAIAVAVASAREEVAVAEGMVVCAELGLSGELRQVAHAERRLSEAARLGFREAVVPARCTADVPGLRLYRAAHLKEALGAVLSPRSDVVGAEGARQLPTPVNSLHGPTTERETAGRVSKGGAGRPVP